MTRRRAILIHAMFLAGFVAVMVPSWLWVIYQTIIPVSQIENRATTTTVKAGDELLIYSKVQRHRLCDTTVERTVFDGQSIRYVFEKIRYVAAPGPIGTQEYVQKIPLPATAAAGPARAQIGLSWRCSVLNEIFPLTDVITIQFEIVRP